MDISNTLKIVATATLLIALPATAQAESARTAEYQACMDRVDYGAMKNSQWHECAQDELARQDVVLNAEYKVLRASLSNEQKNLLLQGQRAWLKYRDNWCSFEEQGNSAPGGAVNHNWCMLELTDQQIKMIQGQQ